MSATSSTQWFWSDWLGDQEVRRLTPAERGVWIDCLALMAVAKPIGYLCDERGRPLSMEEVARVVNATPEITADLLAAILEKGAASQDRTGRIYNRRMVRKASTAAKKRQSGKLGGAATRMKWQAFSSSPQQNAWHMPGHRVGPPFLSKKITSTSSVAAREQERVDKPSQQDDPAGDLASALPMGALARPPDDVPVEGKQEAVRRKLPHEFSRDEIAALAEAKRAKEAAELAAKRPATEQEPAP